MYNCITYLTQNKNRGTGFMWRFPKTELPPSHRQFLFGIFHETNHAAVGYLHDYGNHHLLREPPRPSDAKRRYPGTASSSCGTILVAGMKGRGSPTITASAAGLRLDVW